MIFFEVKIFDLVIQSGCCKTQANQKNRDWSQKLLHEILSWTYRDGVNPFFDVGIFLQGINRSGRFYHHFGLLLVFFWGGNRNGLKSEIL